MVEIIELQNVEEVCRLCLSPDEPKSSIFGVEDSMVPLVDKIQACLSIQIKSTDKLSKLICKECVQNVNQWHNYKETCLQSQDKLRKWLARQTQSDAPMVRVKDEPMDMDFCEDNIEIISESTDLSESRTEENQSNAKEKRKVNDRMRIGESSTATSSPVQIEVTDKEPQNLVRVQELSDDEAKSTRSVSKRRTSERLVAEKERVKEKELCIKNEPQDDYDTDCTVEVESVIENDLMSTSEATATSAGQDDRVMEADSTQKSSATASSSNKKKLRRGPHTHFRGARLFKKKCTYCRINLHSKWSYSQHMKRFHSQATEEDSSNAGQDYEMIEDVEDELNSMEKDAPLTQVQQNIISQLKTFSCYDCQQSFPDRRSTLNHIRQHMPDLRPHCCIACLTEFPDAAMYKIHCEASFECAMKIALVVPKQGIEKYFICNMCLKPLNNRKELLSHLSQHSDKQYEELMSPVRSPPKLQPMTSLTSPKTLSYARSQIHIPSPYRNGDPAHNHVCDLCGMIYRYKPNLVKHRELCERISPDVRTSYRCVHCGMTYLVFKKFHSHITQEHKKKDLVCSKCFVKFKEPSDYLAHHEQHRTSGSKTSFDTNFSIKKSDPLQDIHKDDGSSSSGGMMPKFCCALCSQQFQTKAELSEHRNLHLKVKIYSCVICRSMFSSAGALEIHMKDHGIEDPNERNANSSCVEYARIDENSQDANTSVTSDPGGKTNECETCGKLFSNMANVKRHIRNVHGNGSGFPCFECPLTFKTKELCNQHTKIEHNQTAKTLLRCPECPKSFVFQANLDLHYRNVHSNNDEEKRYDCNVCGKLFMEEASLKIHKSWHSRANSKYSLPNMYPTRQISMNEQPPLSVSEMSPEKPAKARKSFPNRPPPKPEGSLQCQVCDDRFFEVTELRKHLWDVHCARNKPEKSFSGDELQCELCTNVFPDRETLKVHMQWHKANPILSDLHKETFPCDICHKHYSSKKILYNHKKLHKVTSMVNMKFHSLVRKPLGNHFTCTICRKIFASFQSLKRHRYNVHGDLNALEPPPMIPIHNKLQQQQQQQHHQQQQQQQQQHMPFEESMFKKQRFDMEETLKMPLPLNAAGTTGKKPVMCHVCKKLFANMSVLYKHKQLMHKPSQHKPPIFSNKMVSVPKAAASSNSQSEYVPLQSRDGKGVACNVCGKQFPGLPNLKQHFVKQHKRPPKFKCQFESCRMAFPTPTNLKNHEMTHVSMMYSCLLCDRHVFNKGAMSDHMYSVHKTIYDVDTNKNFHREIDLTSYVVAGAVGSFCPVCKIKYPNNRAMKIHYFKFHDKANYTPAAPATTDSVAEMS